MEARMPETTIKPKLCKFRESDMTDIEIIKKSHGFHEDMTAIRFALHLAAVLAVQPIRKNSPKISRRKA
jgi:hypothetical protein